MTLRAQAAFMGELGRLMEGSGWQGGGQGQLSVCCSRLAEVWGRLLTGEIAESVAVVMRVRGLHDVAVELTSRSAETCGEGCSQGDACCIPCQFIPFACLTLATLYAPKFEPMCAHTAAASARG